MTAVLDEVLADSRVVALRDLRDSHAARARDAQARYALFSQVFLVATAISAVAGR